MNGERMCREWNGCIALILEFGTVQKLQLPETIAEYNTMRTRILLALSVLLLCWHNLSANNPEFKAYNFGLLRDPSGWIEVKASADPAANTVVRLKENTVISFENVDRWREDILEDDWIPISYSLHPFEFSNCEGIIRGFVPYKQILPIIELPNANASEFSFSFVNKPFDVENNITLGQSVFGRTFRDSTFVLNNLDETFIEEHGIAGLCINGRVIWGWENVGYPWEQIADVTVKVKGKSIDVHPVFYSDMFNHYDQGTFYTNGSDYFVLQYGGDGAYVYQILWVFDENGLKRIGRVDSLP